MQTTKSTQPGEDAEAIRPSNRILVPLDGSSLAEMALPYAVALAQATASGLLLLRVVPPIKVLIPITPGTLLDESSEIWDLYDEQPDYCWHYLHDVAERLTPMQIDVETYVTGGIPADTIVEYARTHPEISAIAMSTHGRSGIGLWILGSVAEKVLHSSPVPLLLIRSEGRHDLPELLESPRLKTLLVPLDGSPFAEQALGQAKSIALAVEARLVVVSVASTPFDLKLVKSEAGADWSARPWYTPAAQMANYLDGVTQQLAAEGISVEAQVTYGDVADEILKSAKFMEADLIVMSTHGLGGLSRLMLGSVATRVAQLSHTPLLLVRVAKPKEIAQQPASAPEKQPAEFREAAEAGVTC